MNGNPTVKVSSWVTWLQVADNKGPIFKIYLHVKLLQTLKYKEIVKKMVKIKLVALKQIQTSLNVNFTKNMISNHMENIGVSYNMVLFQTTKTSLIYDR